MQIDNEDENKFENLKYDYNLRMSTGVILLINCPPLMQFGLDNSNWKIGPKFMGIKLIPFGSHYIYYSLNDEEYAIKQGFFIDVNKNQLIHIRKWDNEIEDFISLKDEDEKNFSIGVTNLEFDPFLGNYPFEQYENWKDLTKYINYDIISKIQPISKKFITSSKEYEGDYIDKLPEFSEDEKNKNTNKENNQKSTNIVEDEFVEMKIDTNEEERDNNSAKKENKNNFKKMQEKINNNLNFDSIKSNLYYTNIPKNKIFLATEKIEHSLITKNNIDKSFILEELIIKEFKNNEDLILGEFQFSFITFFIAEIYESFEQWKNICLLILNCQEIISKKEKFFGKFIEVLYNQFRNFPKDFFIDELTTNNFFKRALENFINYIKEDENKTIQNSIKKRIFYFEKFLKEFFGFSVKDENSKIIESYLNNVDIEDDELPVIVDEEEINNILSNQIQNETNENTVNNTDNETDDNDINMERF